jgi:hypothetical protein
LSRRMRSAGKRILLRPDQRLKIAKRGCGWDGRLGCRRRIEADGRRAVGGISIAAPILAPHAGRVAQKE